MRTAVFRSVFLLLALSGYYLHAFPSKETSQTQQELDVIGVLRLVGNEPFTFIVLTDSAGNDYKIEGIEKNNLIPYIGRKVRIHGVLSRKPVETANGQRLKDELTISKAAFEPYSGN